MNIARRPASTDSRRFIKNSPPTKSTEAPSDWRCSMLSRLRELIQQGVPGITEEQNWRKPSNPEGVPTWSRHGLIYTGET